MQVFLIREIRIHVLVAVVEGFLAGHSVVPARESDIKEFTFNNQPRKILYFMRNDIKNPDGSIRSSLRSKNFVTAIDMEYLKIPRNGVEFFLLLLVDVETKWMQLVASAKLHLAKIVNWPV